MERDIMETIAVLYAAKRAEIGDDQCFLAQFDDGHTEVVEWRSGGYTDRDDQLYMCFGIRNQNRRNFTPPIYRSTSPLPFRSLGILRNPEFYGARTEVFHESVEYVAG